MNTHMIAHVVSSNFPCLTQFGQTGGLGPLFQSGIQFQVPKYVNKSKQK